MCACFSRSEQIVSGMYLSQCGLPMRFLGHNNLQEDCYHPRTSSTVYSVLEKNYLPYFLIHPRKLYEKLQNPLYLCSVITNYLITLLILFRQVPTTVP